MTSSAVLITGAAKRLGREIALYLARQGFDIALHYNTSRDAAEKTRADILALGRKCEIFRADLREVESLPALITDVMHAMPHCRHLVNNAAVFKRGSFLEAEGTTPEEHMAVNFRAPLILTRVFASAVLQFSSPCKGADQGGGQGIATSCSGWADPHPNLPPSRGKETCSIVNILDARIHDTRHAYFFYLLSKKALADFTLMAAAELAPRVRVNAVCPPSVMETSDGRHPAPSAPHPSPADVAKAVHGLIASESTGEMVFVGTSK